MTDALVAFLRARLEDDERVARGTRTPPDWHQGPVEDPEWESNEVVHMWPPEHHTPYEQDKHWRGLTTGAELAAHIARQDPARTLREVEAKRQLVGIFEIAVRNEALPHPQHVQGIYPPAVFISGYRAALEYTLRCFAALYADHPDYQADWAPWEAENA